MIADESSSIGDFGDLWRFMSEIVGGVSYPVVLGPSIMHLKNERIPSRDSVGNRSMIYGDHGDRWRCTGEIRIEEIRR